MTTFTTGRFFIGAFALTLSAAACSLEDAGGTAVDMCDPDCDLVCSASLRLTGTLEPAGEAPGPDDGCVPMGTWTINVEIVPEQNTCNDVPIDDQYVYTVVEDEIGRWQVSLAGGEFNGEPDLGVQANGPGDCVGGFEHLSADGTHYLWLHVIERELSIEGEGAYELYRR